MCTCTLFKLSFFYWFAKSSLKFSAYSMLLQILFRHKKSYLWQLPCWSKCEIIFTVMQCVILYFTTLLEEEINVVRCCVRDASLPVCFSKQITERKHVSPQLFEEWVYVQIKNVVTGNQCTGIEVIAFALYVLLEAWFTDLTLSLELTTSYFILFNFVCVRSPKMDKDASVPQFKEQTKFKKWQCLY